MKFSGLMPKLARSLGLVSLCVVSAMAAEPKALSADEKLAAIRQGLLEAALEGPTQVQATQWIDDKGALRETSSYRNGMQVRGVRVLGYTQDATGKPNATLQWQSVPDRAITNASGAARVNGWWFEQRVFPPDTEILRAGDPADAAYLILEGTCEVRQGDGPIAEVGEGEIFGEAALIDGGVRTASVVATSEVVVRVLSRRSLEAELARSGWMGPLVRGLAERFHELSTDRLKRRV